MVEDTQAVTMVEAGTRVVIMAAGGTRAGITVEATQAAIMDAEDTRAVIITVMAVTVVGMVVTVTAMAMVATVIMAGMVDGATVTTLTPGEYLSMVIRAGGGLILTVTPIMLIHTGTRTREPTCLSIHINLPRRRSLNRLPHSTRDSSSTTGTTARECGRLLPRH